MAYWDNGLLRVSDNGKYLQNGEVPFFWMGDTAWLLFHKNTEEAAAIYLKNRKSKGFNVIQATLVHYLEEEKDESKRDNAVEVKWDVTASSYWEHCVTIVRMAEKLGMYMALLPTWGSLVKQKILTVDNVEGYAVHLAKYFGDCPNVIWLLGGDIKGEVNPELYSKFGTKLKEMMPDKLVGFHPFGRTSSSLWFHEEKWLDFNMFQSGHRRYDQGVLKQWDDVAVEFYGEDNWKYVDRDHSYDTRKPTVDGEPSYEWIPQGLHDPKEPFWQAWDVRRYAYWAVFQGAMGHTYGDSAIMQFWYEAGKPAGYGTPATWKEALHHEGSSHMKHLADLMNSVDYMEGAPAEKLLLSGQKEQYARVSVFAGTDYILAYTYLGEEFTLDLSGYTGKTLHAYWYDPTSGVYSYLQEVTGMSVLRVKPPVRYAGQSDWVLVIR